MRYLIVVLDGNHRRGKHREGNTLSLWFGILNSQPRQGCVVHLVAVLYIETVEGRVAIFNLTLCLNKKDNAMN